MNRHSLVIALCCLLGCCTVAATQTVKTGYDSTIDFSRYKTYTWMEATSPPPNPQFWDTLAGAIDDQLKSKGMTSVAAHGDLILQYAGGIDSSIGVAAGSPVMPTYSSGPAGINSTMWTGSLGTAPAAAAFVSKGTLVVEFLDPALNKVIWRGTLTGKVDLERKKKSIERINNAVAKLFKNFPPAKP